SHFGLNERSLLADPGRPVTVPGDLPVTAGRGGSPRTAAEAIDALEALAGRPGAGPAGAGWRAERGPAPRAGVRRGGAAARGRGRGGAPAGPHARRGGQRAPRAGGQVRPGRAVRLADARAGERPADRAELLLGGPQGDPVA